MVDDATQLVSLFFLLGEDLPDGIIEGRQLHPLLVELVDDLLLDLSQRLEGGGDISHLDASGFQHSATVDAGVAT